MWKQALEAHRGHANHQSPVHISYISYTGEALYRCQVTYKPAQPWNVRGNWSTWGKRTRSRGEHSTSIQTAPVVRIILGLWCCEAATLLLHHNAAIVNSDIGSDLVLSQAQSTVPSDA